MLASVLWRIRGLGFIEKRLILGLIAGIASSIIVVLFYWLVVLVVESIALLLGVNPVPVSDLSMVALLSPHSTLLLITIPLGALMSGLLVARIEPLAKGPGTNVTIKLYHYGLEMRKRTPIVKAVASAILVGSGGSGGLQGPSIQVGAGIGSYLARVLGLNIMERRVLMIAGMAGALSAIFRSPIGSALFALEVLYRRDLEVEAIVPALVSSIVSYSITVHFIGYDWIFPRVNVHLRQLFAPYAIITYILLGLLAAGFTLAYIKLYLGVSKLFERIERMHKKPWINPLLGSIPVALMGFYIPHIVGSGSTMISLIIQDSASGTPDTHLLCFGVEASLLILLVAKTLATSFSIGSGGSGGLFAPSIFVGGVFGLLFGLVAGAPLSGLPPYIYAYIGMASVFGAATNTPLATAIMVAEMGNNYILIIPAIIGSLIANELIRYDTIYPAQVMRRTHPRLMGLKIILKTIEAYPQLRNLRVKDFENTEYQPVTVNHTLGEAVKTMREYRQRLVPVIDERGIVVGVIDSRVLREIRISDYAKKLLEVRELRKDIILARPEEKLLAVVERMDNIGADYSIIVDEEKRYRGVLLLEDLSMIISQYLAPT